MHDGHEEAAVASSAVVGEWEGTVQEVAFLLTSPHLIKEITDDSIVTNNLHTLACLLR